MSQNYNQFVEANKKVIVYEEICETVEYGDKDPSRQGFRKVADRRKVKSRKRGRK